MTRMLLILLIVYSAWTANLTLQCALGIKTFDQIKNESKLQAVKKLSLIFLSILILWLVFTNIFSSFFSGIFIYILVFPFCYLTYNGFDHLVSRFIFKKDMHDESFICFPEGITGAALFICLNIADSWTETFVLSFGFTAGILMAAVIIKEVNKRASYEAVPVFLRGKPLVLITMGLLSLVFSSASLLILRMINIR